MTPNQTKSIDKHRFYLKALLLVAVSSLTFSFIPVSAQTITITSAPYNATTGSADNAAAIQAAINAVGSGGTVLVPSGTFLSGPVTLKSNMTFQLAAGAILRMTAMGTFPAASNFLYGSSLSNITINGSGTMDGQGAAWWTAFNANSSTTRPAAMIYLTNCTGVTLTGITVKDSPMFHIQLLGNGTNIYAAGLSITAAWPSPNTDGIDLRGKNVLIENCYISDGDDLIQLGGSQAVQGVTIRNCAFGTGHGLSIGGYTQGGVQDLLVDQCTFNGTQYGIRWKSGRDRGGLNQNLTYSNLTMTGILAYPFFLTSWYPNPSSLPPTSDTAAATTSTTPYWNNITLRNITASTASGAKSPGIMWAVPEAPVSNVLLDAVTVTGPSGVNFEFHHARGVTIDCNVRVNGQAPPTNIGSFDATISYPACGPTPTKTNTPVVTNTPTRTNTPVPPTNTPTRTFTAIPPTNTFTSTPTRTNTAVPPTMTFTSTSTFTFTPTRTNTPVPPTMTFTSTATSTATPTRTSTPVPPTATFTLPPSFTATASFTSTRTNTPIPPTSTFTFTATNTATATRTNTPVPPTATNTLAPPTSTSTSTSSFTSTRTNTPVPPTATPTFTAVPPTATPTNSPSLPTATFTSVPPTATSTNTMVPPTATFTGVPPTVTPTNSPVPPTVTLTNSPVPPTATSTNTSVPPTNTNTPVPPTATSTFTAIPPTVTSTNSPVPPTATSTHASVPPTNTSTNTPVPPTATHTDSTTPTPSATLTATPSASPTKTNTLVPPTATLTNTPIPPTATRTNTPVPPTNTFTSVPPTVTFTSTPTRTNSFTPSFTPTLTASFTTTPTPSTAAFVVQLLSGVTSDSTNSPHPQIQVVNTGTAPLALNGVTVKYWFNCDCTTQSLQAWVDWAGLIPSGTTVTSDIQVSVQPTSLGGQTDYVLYTFTGNLVLQPGQSIQIQSRFNKNDFSNMIQSNDWSYAANTSFINQTKVTGYQNGALVWGQEPVATSSALTVSSAMAFPNPSTGTGTTLAFTLGNNTTAQTVSPGQPVVVDPNAAISLKIYTTAFRMIWSQTLTGGSYGTSGEHSLPWDEKDRLGSPLANGVYLLRVTATSQGQTTSSIGKILILR